MKFILATLFSVSALMVSAQQEYASSTVYTKSPCTAPKFLFVLPSTGSGDSSSCKLAQTTLNNLVNSTTCYDLSKVNPENTGLYSTFECTKEDPEAFAKKVFGTTKYFANVQYSDTKCATFNGALFVVPDGVCYPTVSGSYKVTTNTDGTYTMDAYSNTNVCAGTAVSTKFKASDLSQSCSAVNEKSQKTYFNSGIRSAVSLIALGSIVVMSFLMTLF